MHVGAHGPELSFPAAWGLGGAPSPPLGLFPFPETQGWAEAAKCRESLAMGLHVVDPVHTPLPAERLHTGSLHLHWATPTSLPKEKNLATLTSSSLPALRSL